MENHPRQDDPSASGLVWGIKESFLRYVATIPDGVCELYDGTVPHSPGRFLFPRADREGEYAGTLTVFAYAGLLCVTVANPRIRVADGRHQLVVDTGSGDDSQLAVANLQLTTADGSGRLAYTATLTDEGCEWLGGNYTPGIEMDTVEIL
jgi:hypothetical protein